MENKRYFWLKLPKDFFRDKKVKKLRSIAGGDTYTIIYLKMMLSSLETDGIITYEGVEPTFAEEIALDLDESEDNVSITINYLINAGLLIDIGENQYKLPFVKKSTGSEGASAQRMRAHRKRKASLCDKSVTLPLHMRYVETDTETDTEIDIETDKDRDSDLLTNIKSVCQSRDLSIDPVQIYEQIRQNNTKVKNLEKYLVSVDEYQKAEKKQSGSGTKFNENFHQREYDFENLESQLLKAERKEET